MIATANSWTRQPFNKGVPIPYRDHFTPAQMARIRQGLIPSVMEDKWFIYFDEPILYLHRSWTGQPVYKVTFAPGSENGKVVEALLSDDLPADDGDHQAALLDFLVSNLLLEKSKPFPVPAGIEEAVPGVYQHATAGTGYPEAPPPVRRRPWWQFWR